VRISSVPRPLFRPAAARFEAPPDFFTGFAEHQGLFHIFHSYDVEMQIVEEL
jgi:hypothetical protein